MMGLLDNDPTLVYRGSILPVVRRRRFRPDDMEIQYNEFGVPGLLYDAAQGAVNIGAMSQGDIPFDEGLLTKSVLDAPMTAGLLAGAAGMVPKGAVLGTFAGSRAKTANLDALKKAKTMQKEGQSRDEIWNQTGWFKDVDGNWKFEIDDSMARMREVAEPKVTPGKIYRAEDIMEHPELYAAYTRTGRDLGDVQHDIRKNSSTINYLQFTRENSGKQGYEPFTKEMAQDLDGALQKRKELLKEFETLKEQPASINVPVVGRFVSEMPAGVLGSYSPTMNQITTTQLRNFDIAENVDKAKRDYQSTLLHELQHVIQDREGFAKGGTPEVAGYAKAVAARESFDELGGAQTLNNYNSAADKYAELASMDVIHGYLDIKQPRHLFGTGGYYRFSDELRREFGPPPKRSGQARNDWIADAGRFIANKLQLEHNMRFPMGDVRFRHRNSFKTADQKKLFKNELRRAEYALNKFDGQKIRKLKDAHATLNNALEGRNPNLTDQEKYEIYKNLAGEAEARNVQTRMDFTPEQRKAKPPYKTLDVPEDQLIVSKNYFSNPATASIPGLLNQTNTGNESPTMLDNFRNELLGLLFNPTLPDGYI